METCERYAESPIASVGTKFLAATVFAAVTGVGGRLVFHLGFTPIPVTLQVLCVILSGLVLGGRWGAVSQMQYLVMGLMGFPFFTGTASLAGPTGGYLLGFVAGAYVCGSLFELLRERTKGAAWIAGVMGIVAIYSLGIPWLACWFRIAGKSWTDSLLGAWQLGAVPFIGIDLLKAGAAAGLAFGGSSWQGIAHRFRI